MSTMSRKRVKRWGEFEEPQPSFVEGEDDVKVSIAKINQLQEVVRANKELEAQHSSIQKK